MGERIFTLEILGNAYELPLIVAALPLPLFIFAGVVCLALFSERAAK